MGVLSSVVDRVELGSRQNQCLNYIRMPKSARPNADVFANSPVETRPDWWRTEQEFARFNVPGIGRGGRGLPMLRRHPFRPSLHVGLSWHPLKMAGGPLRLTALMGVSAASRIEAASTLPNIGPNRGRCRLHPESLGDTSMVEELARCG